MYAQVRKYHSIRGGGTTEQVCRDIERTALSRFDQVPGFVDYFVLALNDGGLLTVSIYEDRAGVEAAKELSAKWNTSEAAGSLPERPDEAFEGEVRIHHPAPKTAAVA
jgi:hypothetical protein